MISLDDIVKDVKSVVSHLNRIPSLREYDKLGKFSHGTIIKRVGKWNRFLMKSFGKIHSLQHRAKPENPCLCCQKITSNSKFCSRSCAATYNNKIYPKRKSRKTKFLCPSCKSELMNQKSKMCKRCTMKYYIDKFGERMLKDFSSTFARHKYQAIRNHAKQIAKFYGFEKKCKVCEYDINVDLCHIKPIGNFDKNSRVSEINSLKNITYLCKNHHWEMDHGLLKLKDGASDGT